MGITNESPETFEERGFWTFLFYSKSCLYEVYFIIF